MTKEEATERDAWPRTSNDLDPGSPAMADSAQSCSPIIQSTCICTLSPSYSPACTMDDIRSGCLPPYQAAKRARPAHPSRSPPARDGRTHARLYPETRGCVKFGRRRHYTAQDASCFRRWQRLCPSPTASSHPTPLHDTRVSAGGEQDERQRNDLQGGHVRRGALRPVLNALRKSVRASLIIDLGGKWLMFPPAKPV